MSETAELFCALPKAAATAVVATDATNPVR